MWFMAFKKYGLRNDIPFFQSKLAHVDKNIGEEILKLTSAIETGGNKHKFR